MFLQKLFTIDYYESRANEFFLPYYNQTHTYVVSEITKNASQPLVKRKKDLQFIIKPIQNWEVRTNLNQVNILEDFLGTRRKCA